MIVIRDGDKLQTKGVVATIGFFDGVHMGHRFLIDRLNKEASTCFLPSAVITFPEHPRTILHADYQPKLLNTFEEKVERLATTGVDYCIVLSFTYELSLFPARDFLELLAGQYNVKGLLIGYDHRFGHNSNDCFEDYIRYGEEVGIKVIPATAFENGETQVSSSLVRRLLSAGKVEDAAGLLTYPYVITGEVVAGHQIGRKLGFPTANIHVLNPCKIIPSSGVYAVWAFVDGKRYKGMLHIGNRPTLDNGEDISLEVHLLNFQEDIYLKKIDILFIYYLRENSKFENLWQLQEQLEIDKRNTDQLLTEY